MSKVVDIGGKEQSTCDWPEQVEARIIHLEKEHNKLIEAYNNMIHCCQLLEKRVIKLENPWWIWW